MKRTIFLLLAIIAFVHVSEARQPKRGYRGFLEWSNSVRSDYVRQEHGNWENQLFLSSGFTTSHGYQINPMFFVGAGVGMELCGKLDNWVVPVFIQGRVDLKFGKFTPFGDLRIGVNAAGPGIYFSPTIGYRFNWGRKMGVNLGAGLSLAGYREKHYEDVSTGSDSYEYQYVGTKSHTHPYFSFRLGIDF